GSDQALLLHGHEGRGEAPPRRRRPRVRADPVRSPSARAPRLHQRRRRGLRRAGRQDRLLRDLLRLRAVSEVEEGPAAKSHRLRWPVKYCPNPACPYALRHRESQEYQDWAQTCADCGTALVSERPVPAMGAEGEREPPWGRIAATVLIPGLVAWLTPRVPLPCLDVPRIEWAHTGELRSLRLSAFALGLGPMLSAAILVELAALCVPGWRAMRV